MDERISSEETYNRRKGKRKRERPVNGGNATTNIENNIIFKR